MALNGINGIHQKNIEKTEITNGQSSTQLNHILEFAERNYDINKNELSDANVKTKMFKEEIMSKLNTSKSKETAKTTKYYLDKLIKVTQELNGVQKNNLKPNGTKKQNENFEKAIQVIIWQMKSYAEELVGSGLSVIQDSKTGLYKLCIDNKLYNIPERKVEIVAVKVEAIHPDDLTEELVPEITD